jgi:hypothetical protein
MSTHLLRLERSGSETVECRGGTRLQAGEKQ